MVEIIYLYTVICINHSLLLLASLSLVGCLFLWNKKFGVALIVLIILMLEAGAHNSSAMESHRSRRAGVPRSATKEIMLSGPVTTMGQ